MLKKLLLLLFFFGLCANLLPLDYTGEPDKNSSYDFSAASEDTPPAVDTETPMKFSVEKNPSPSDAEVSKELAIEKTNEEPAEKDPPLPGTKTPAEPSIKRTDEEPTEKNSSPPRPDAEETPAPSPQPVSYIWGSAQNYLFRTQVRITNQGDDLSRGVLIHLPMLENDSPYQDTALSCSSHEPVSVNGRIGTFHLGDIQPGETVTLTIDYDISVRPIALSSTNNTVEKAHQIYRRLPKDGNCLQLAQNFVNECVEAGITARVVTGYVCPQRNNITPGPLRGHRHSWAEYYIDNLGWVPVDLAFQYFSQFPHRSHILETYHDQSLQINFLGGKPKATWENFIQ